MSVDLRTWEEAVVWLRAQPEKANLVRDCFFDDPLIAAAKRYYASTEWAAVRDVVGINGGQVLDVGAGRGTSSYAFARDGWHVTALEPDSSAVVGSQAIKNLFAEARLAITVEEAWGEELPFEDASFDVVYCRQVLHHARDLPQLCREIGRVLRPGGRLLATREHVVFKHGDLESFWAKHPLHSVYGGEFAYPLSEYKSAIEGAGIRITKVINPWASDINSFPRTSADIGEVIHRRMPIIPKKLLNPRVLASLGWLLREPGASYSFIGVRES